MGDVKNKVQEVLPPIVRRLPDDLRMSRKVRYCCGGGHPECNAGIISIGDIYSREVGVDASGRIQYYETCYEGCKREE